MTTTYDSIASTTLSTTASTITFTSISQSFTDLILVITAKSTSGAFDIRCRVGNGTIDTGSSYSYTYLSGDGSSALSGRASSQTFTFVDIYGSVTTDFNHNGIYHFMNYSNTTTNKTILSRSNRAASGTDAIVGLWRSTSAIDRIELALGSSATGTFDTGTIASLYGIKAE
jgi:hypothetical protein